MTPAVVPVCRETEFTGVPEIENNAALVPAGIVNGTVRPAGNWIAGSSPPEAAWKEIFNVPVSGTGNELGPPMACGEAKDACTGICASGLPVALPPLTVKAGKAGRANVTA